MHVRIIDLPISDKLRDLRQGDLNNLVRVSGVVTRRTGVFPQLLSVAYDCGSCSAVVGPFKVSGAEIRPDSCPNCSSRGPFRINQQRTHYGNYQKLTLQETPGTVPPGRVPRYKDVTLLGDLIDYARPGEEIEITGIYGHSQQQISKKNNGFPVFSTIIEANCIQKKHGGSTASWSEDDRKKILELSKDPQIGERIIRSMAPSIYGHRHVKTALALSLFGGVHKDGGQSTGMHRVRGDVNVLLLGEIF
jgi:DNA replication licensing factor MCM2